MNLRQIPGLDGGYKETVFGIWINFYYYLQGEIGNYEVTGIKF